MTAPARRYVGVLAFVVLWATPAAHAARLEVAVDAPAWAHLGAAALLVLHIGGGALGLLSGTAALASRKGGRRHVSVGRIFFGSMLVTYLIGGLVAPFLTEGQRPNFVAAVLALYLLLSGVSTARRRDFQAGIREQVGLCVALTITGMGALFAYLGAMSPTGTIDGSPPGAFVVFIVGGSIAAIDEARVLIRQRLSPAARTVRHLWRMCFSFFIASGSLFLGQPQVFPAWFNGSLLPAVLAFAPLIAIPLWWVRLRVGAGRLPTQ